MKNAILSLALFATLVTRSLASTITVALDGSGDFTLIQPAIDAAADGDEVVVAPGEYVITEPIDFNRLHDPEKPASPPVKNIWLRSEAGAGETTIRMSEEPADADRACVVIFESGETDASVVEGFTLTGGTEGVFCYGESAATVRSCDISGNRYAGVYCGGGYDSASVTLIDCAVTGNSSSGVYCRSFGSLTLERCRISGNRSYYGGGVYCNFGRSAILRDCVISANAALDSGLRSSSGGLGGGLYCRDVSMLLTRCTIAGNSSRGGGGLYMWEDEVAVTSCILWDNRPDAIYARATDQLRVTYSCTQDARWPGWGNFSADPLFGAWGEAGEIWVDAAQSAGGDGTEASPYSSLGPALDYSLALATGSPCLSGGEDGARIGANTGVCDQAGEARRVVHLAPGTYPMEGRSLNYGASLEGSGRDETTIEGAVHGLSTDAAISDVTITKGILWVGATETAEVCDSRISGESGLSCQTSSVVTVSGCTLTGNPNAGLHCATDSSVTLLGCTITGNAAVQGGGVVCAKSSSLLMKNSILWDNCGGSIQAYQSSWDEELNAYVEMAYSCVEGEEVWPGEGNTNADPHFLGWGAVSEVDVSSQTELEEALRGFELALAFDSPCLGTGEGGADMGADTGTCDLPGLRGRRIRLAPGTFTLEGMELDLVHGVSIEGAGPDVTIIEGTVSGLRTGAVLSDVTVTGGADGGIRVGVGQAPEIRDCTIAGNDRSLGGGVYAEEGSAPRLVRCTISENSAGSGGGVAGEGQMTLEDCVISGNSASSGGGLYLEGAATLLRCEISGNFAGSEGGGVYCHDLAAGLTDCRVEGNVAQGDVFWARGGGGGLFFTGESTATLTGCVIRENATNVAGGGVLGAGKSQTILTRCTISGNASDYGAVHAGSSGATVTLTSCIVWDNAVESLTVGGGVTAGELQVSYSCVEGASRWPGTRNINADPRFGAWGDVTET